MRRPEIFGTFSILKDCKIDPKAWLRENLRFHSLDLEKFIFLHVMLTSSLQFQSLDFRLFREEILSREGNRVEHWI